MPQTPKPAAPPKQYLVQLNKVGTVAGMKLSPKSNPVLVSEEGRAELETQGAIESVEEV